MAAGGIELSESSLGAREGSGGGGWGPEDGLSRLSRCSAHCSKSSFTLRFRASDCLAKLANRSLRSCRIFSKELESRVITYFNRRRSKRGSAGLGDSFWGRVYGGAN